MFMPIITETLAEITARIEVAEAAVAKKTFTKARREIREALFQLSCFTGSVKAVDELHARASKVVDQLPPPPPPKPRKKTALQLRREAHERFLYKNNTYQG